MANGVDLMIEQCIGGVGYGTILPVQHFQRKYLGSIKASRDLRGLIEAIIV
jgi:hypothetical protein